MFDDEVRAAAARVLDLARARKLRVATAESCTGGLIAGALTEIAGSSEVFDRGFVTYSNEAKEATLGVPRELLAAHGAVSAEVARAMAQGAIQNSRADVAVAATGIAGPGGGSAQKPVGLVYVAVSPKSAPEKGTVLQLRFGDIGRSAVRRATIIEALKAMESHLVS